MAAAGGKLVSVFLSNVYAASAGADGTGTPDYKMYSTHSYPAKDAKFASAVHDWVGKSTPKHGWSFGTDSFLLRRLADESVNARLQAFSKGQGGF